MKKRNLLIILFTVLLTLVFPFLSTRFKGDEGTAIAFMLFFWVSPVAILLIGILSGQNFKSCWFQPLLFSVLYTLGLRTFLKMGPNEFLKYGMKYFLMSYAVALLSVLFTQRRRRIAAKEAQKKK